MWIFSRHGHINQVSQVWRTEWLTEKVRQYDRTRIRQKLQMNRTWPLLYCLEEAPVINPHLPRMAACLVGHCPPPHPPPLCEKLAFSSSDLFLLVGINPHPSFSNSKCWVKVWSVYPICERVAIIVPACQSAGRKWSIWEEIWGNLRK